jgi:tetratricopeptide (TPR) repeat protein
VYSLGGLLYELLTGRYPFPPSEKHGTNLLQWVCHGEPQAPSTVLDRDGEKADATTVCAVRGRGVRALRRRLEGDLDAIVLKALTKDAAHRYGSVQALADDIRRHLAGHPVAARRWTLAYQTSKFVRQHWKALGVALLLLVLLGTWVENWRQTHRADAAEGENLALQEYLIGVFSQPGRHPKGEDLTALDLLDVAELKSRTDLALYPDLQARQLNVLGYVRLELEDTDKAEALLEESLRLRRETPGISETAAIPTLINLAKAREEARGDLEGARTLLDEALRLSGEDGTYHVRILRNLAGIHEGLAAEDDVAAEEQDGHLNEAVALYRKALQLQRERKGVEDPDLAWIRNNLAYTLEGWERPEKNEEAIGLYQENLKLHRAGASGLEAPVAASLLHWAHLLLQEELVAEAERYLQESVELHMQVHGENEDTANARHAHGLALQELGRFDEAGATLEKARDIYTEANDAESATHVQRDLGYAQCLGGAQDAGLKNLDSALDLFLSFREGDANSVPFTKILRASCLWTHSRRTDIDPSIQDDYRQLMESDDLPARWRRLIERFWSQYDTSRTATISQE